VSSAPAARTLQVRHVQIARAVVAAVAAAVITFSSDHSAALGLGVFGGFAIATALVLLAAARTVYPAGRRAAAVAVGALSIVAGVIALIPPLRSVGLFIVLVVVWGVATGVIETVDGWRARRAARSSAPAAGSLQRLSEARDAITVGVITVILGLALLLVPGQYALRYYIAEAHQSFTLTGITIAVGIFGGYAAIVAVYLGIAAFSPRRETDAAASLAADASVAGDGAASPAAPESASGVPASDEHSGGAA
jgi:hypothetical protein